MAALRLEACADDHPGVLFACMERAQLLDRATRFVSLRARRYPYGLSFCR